VGVQLGGSPEVVFAFFFGFEFEVGLVRGFFFFESPEVFALKVEMS